MNIYAVTDNFKHANSIDAFMQVSQNTLASLGNRRCTLKQHQFMNPAGSAEVDCISTEVFHSQV